MNNTNENPPTFVNGFFVIRVRKRTGRKPRQLQLKGVLNYLISALLKTI